MGTLDHMKEEDSNKSSNSSGSENEEEAKNDKQKNVTVVKPKNIDWSKIDTDVRRKNYETQDPYPVIKNIIYHYIGPPVNKLFPSADNLKSVLLPGLYFTGLNFLFVRDVDSDSPDAEIVFPFLGDINKVTFSVKFIPNDSFYPQKYFGTKFTCSDEYTSAHYVLNLSKSVNSGNKDFRINSFDIVNVTNPDDAEKFSIHNKPRSLQSASKVDFMLFFNHSKTKLNDPEEELHSIVHIGPSEQVQRLVDNYSRRNSKQTNGQSPFQNNQQPRLPNELYQMSLLMKSSLLIIEDDSLHHYDHKEKKISKLSLIDTANRKLYKSQLESAKTIIESKLLLLKAAKTY